MSNVNLEAEIARLQNENAQLKAKNNHITMKVSEKGCLSVYGLSRFPVSLYREQWEKLLNKAEEIKAFLAEHQAELPKKADKQAA